MLIPFLNLFQLVCKLELFSHLNKTILFFHLRNKRKQKRIKKLLLKLFLGRGHDLFQTIYLQTAHVSNISQQFMICCYSLWFDAVAFVAHELLFLLLLMLVICFYCFCYTRVIIFVFLKICQHDKHYRQNCNYIQLNWS